MAKADTLATIAELGKSHWQDMLADMVEARPSVESLREVAAKDPKSWVWCMSALASLSGYRTGEEARRQSDVHIHVGSGSRVAIGVGSDGRIIDPQAYHAALVRELGPEVAQTMLARLQSRQPVTLEHRQTSDSAPDPALDPPE